MYIATTLGQTSLFHSLLGSGTDLLYVADGQYDAELHGGLWVFMARACIIDQTTYRLDCEPPGANVIQIEIMEKCMAPDANLFEECASDNTGTDGSGEANEEEDQNSEQDSSSENDDDQSDETEPE